MAYYSNKFRNPKLLKLVLKLSSFSALACFFTLFVGAANESKVINVDYYNDKGVLNKKSVVSNCGGDCEKLEQALRNSTELDIGDHDSISIAKSGEEITACVKKAVSFQVEVDGQTKSVKSNPDVTYYEALKTAVNLGEFDEFFVKAPDGDRREIKNSVVENNVTVKVDRVRFENVHKKEAIPFATVSENVDSLFEGEKKVEKAGENGEKEVEYKQKYINDNLVEENKLGEKLVKDPVSEIVKVGTKKKKNKGSDVNSTVSAAFTKGVDRKRSGAVSDPHNAPALPVSDVVDGHGVRSGYATSYDFSAGVRTSLGQRPCVGTVASCHFPFGTRVVVRHRGKVIYTGTVSDYCPTRSTLVDLFGANIGRLLVDVEYWLPAKGVRPIRRHAVPAKVARHVKVRPVKRLTDHKSGQSRVKK